MSNSKPTAPTGTNDTPGAATAREQLKRAEGHEGNATPFTRQLKEKGDAMGKKHGMR